MTILGQLIQPRLKLKWGDVDIVFHPDGEDTGIQSVSFDFQDSEVFPECSLTFSGSPRGYELYRKGIDENKDEPIEISVGYPNGTWLTTQYYYVGANLSSGNSNGIEVTGSAKGKEFLSSFFTNQFVDTTLDKVAETVQDNAGVPEEAKLKPNFTETAKEIASSVVVKGVIAGQTPGKAVNSQLADKGLALDTTAMAQKGGSPTVYAPAGMTAKEGKDSEAAKEPPKDGEVLLRDQTYGYILGPGLIQDFSKSLRWGPGESQNNGLTPISGYNPQPKSTEEGEESEAPKGAKGKSPLATITEENNPQLSITAKEAKERQDKASCSATFFMVPEMVGVKPRDVIFIPSMKLDYLEEWVLDSVSYDFSGGGCNISASGYRFDLGETQKIVSTETYNRFLEKLKSLKTIKDWEKYYWRV